MQDGLQIFWIAKRKFCVHVHSSRHLPNNFQCVSVTEERRLNGMAWDGSKSWPGTHFALAIALLVQMLNTFLSVTRFHAFMV